MPANARNCRRNTNDSAVSSSIAPSRPEMTPDAVLPVMSKCEISSSVSAVAGTLPEASRPTMRHLTVWLRPWTSVPIVLVTEA